MRKVLIYGLIALDIFAIFALSSFSSCFGNLAGEKCKNSLGSPVTWFVIIAAILSTSFYMYKRYQAQLPLFPFNLNLFEKLKVSWMYALYFFFALIFFGENLPEIAGYLQGLPLGAPGTHASLMEPSLFFTGNSSTLINLAAFAAIAFVFAFLFRYLNILMAYIIAVTIGSSIEFATHVGKPADIPEGFDLVNNFYGTITTFIWLWSLLVLVPLAIYQAINRFWGNKGIIVTVVVLVLLNILSYFFFLYERDVLKNTLDQRPSFIQGQGEVIAPNTCPDQLTMNNGKPMAYKNGQPFQVRNQADLDWIKTNCPNLQNQPQ